MNETIGVKGGKQDLRRQMRIKKRRKSDLYKLVSPNL